MSENDIPVSELPEGQLAVITSWSVACHVGEIVFRFGSDLYVADGRNSWPTVFAHPHSIPADEYRIRLLRDGARLVYDGNRLSVEEPCPCCDTKPSSMTFTVSDLRPKPENVTTEPPKPVYVERLKVEADGEDVELSHETGDFFCTVYEGEGNVYHAIMANPDAPVYLSVGGIPTAELDDATICKALEEVSRRFTDYEECKGLRIGCGRVVTIYDSVGQGLWEIRNHDDRKIAGGHGFQSFLATLRKRPEPPKPTPLELWEKVQKLGTMHFHSEALACSEEAKQLDDLIERQGVDSMVSIVWRDWKSIEQATHRCRHAAALTAWFRENGTQPMEDAK